ncbi:hypothetical protein HOA93_01225 [bacterium]|nr:hypothetical protein [bacterium]
MLNSFLYSSDLFFNTVSDDVSKSCTSLFLSLCNSQILFKFQISLASDFNISQKVQSYHASTKTL